MTASLRRGNRFASDSTFEGEGFELRVPLARKAASRGGEGAGGRSRWSRKACSFSRGTRGSSPSPPAVSLRTIAKRQPHHRSFKSSAGSSLGDVAALPGDVVDEIVERTEMSTD